MGNVFLSIQIWNRLDTMIIRKVLILIEQHGITKFRTILLKNWMIPLLTISIWLLFIAVIPILPYPFYLLLRLIVSISCFVAYYNVRHIIYPKTWLKPSLIVIGILFNPLVPVHLTRFLWLPVDIVCGIVLMKARKEIILFKDLIDNK